MKVAVFSTPSPSRHSLTVSYGRPHKGKKLMGVLAVGESPAAQVAGI